MIRYATAEAEAEHQKWLKRHAVQIVAQLPEDEADALKILSHARELILRFIGDAPANRTLSLVREMDED